MLEQTLRDTDRSFFVEELALLAYPGINRAEKKHRVTVLRALDNVAKTVPLFNITTYRAPWRLIVTSLLNVRSYAHGVLRAEWWGNAERSLEQVEMILSDAEVQSELMAPGTRWWVEVEINKAEAEYRVLLKAAEAAGLVEGDGSCTSIAIDDMSPGMRECLMHLDALRHYYYRSLQPYVHEYDPQPALLGKFEPPGSPMFEYAMKLRQEAVAS
jgi:hypothetical protein